jgi:23S rRNA pseudouridine2604 synthase
MLSRPAAARQQLVRLNKLLASQGWCSRRDADGYIRSGWVRVNGVIRDALGSKVPEDSEIELHPAARRRIASRQTTVILHKPLGIVSCQPERPDQTPAIRLLTHENLHRSDGFRRRQDPHQLPKMAVAGRLDVNSTGLLLFTQCGVTARRLLSGTIEKEYLVRLAEPLPCGGGGDNNSTDSGRAAEELVSRLEQGVESGGDFLEAVSVSIQNENQLKFTLTAGKHHHLRRMCEAVGLEVTALKRVRIGPIELGDLPPGQWRYLKPHEKIF